MGTDIGIRGVNHVALRVRDLETSAGFYKRVLGFTEDVERFGHGVLAFLRAPRSIPKRRPSPTRTIAGDAPPSAPTSTSWPMPGRCATAYRRRRQPTPSRSSHRPRGIFA